MEAGHEDQSQALSTRRHLEKPADKEDGYGGPCPQSQHLGGGGRETQGSRIAWTT